MEPYKTKNPSNFWFEGFYIISYYDYYEYNRTSLGFDERLLDDFDVSIIVFISLVYINFFLFVSTKVNLFSEIYKFF